MALPVLGVILALPCLAHISQRASHMSSWGGSQDQAAREGCAQNIFSVLFKAVPGQTETTVHLKFPNWDRGPLWGQAHVCTRKVKVLGPVSPQRLCESGAG